MTLPSGKSRQRQRERERKGLTEWLPPYELWRILGEDVGRQIAGYGRPKAYISMNMYIRRR